MVGGLALCGGASRCILAPAWTELGECQPAWRLDLPGAALGQGVSLGVFGGFRSLAADFLWLRANVFWEERNSAATLGSLRLVTTVDPRPLVFWLNGARIMAYDIPVWRISALGGREVVPAAVRHHIEAEQARLALAWLDDGLKFHPMSPAIFIEQANICLNCQDDRAAAAANYRRASEQPDAPYYAARLYAELLRRMGRKGEALAWLKQLHPRLPPDDDAAAAALVLARIRELEAELAVPVERRYLQGMRQQKGTN